MILFTSKMGLFSTTSAFLWQAVLESSVVVSRNLTYAEENACNLSLAITLSKLISCQGFCCHPLLSTLFSVRSVLRAYENILNCPRH